MRASKKKQRGFFLNPYRFGGGGLNPPFAEVLLLLHANGTDGSTSFVDSSSHGWTVSAVADAQLDTADKKFGTASFLLDGTTDAVSIPDDAAFTLGTSFFCIEMWIKPASVAAGRHPIFRHGAGFNYIDFSLDGSTLDFIFTGGGVTGGNVTVNVWQHVAVTRDGSNLRIFIDGVLKATNATSGATSINNTGGAVLIGSSPNFSSAFFSGWVDDVRWTKGSTLYTAGFMPPAAAFPDS